MSYPILYGATEELFNTNGYGVLSDATMCEITEEVNGQYELLMKYPVTGMHYEEINSGYLLYCKMPYPGFTGRTHQPFRIYYISEPIKGLVTIQAVHVSYDLSGYPVKPFTSESLTDTFTALHNNALLASPFYLDTDKENKVKKFTVDVPKSMRACMMGEEGSILQRYRGEWTFDHYGCFLTNKLGSNRGVTIRYGKNLIDFTQETETDQRYSHIVAFANYTLSSGKEMVKYGRLLTIDSTIRPRQAFVLDVSDAYVDAVPTRSELDEYAREYAEENAINEPNISYTIQWVQLPDAPEDVRLGDTIKLFYNGTIYTSRVVAYTWNVLTERYKTVEIGRTKRKFYNVIKQAVRNNASQISDQLETASTENLIQNGVRPTQKKPPNILGYTPAGESPYLGTSYFSYGKKTNVSVETIKNGFKTTAVNGAWIDEGFGITGPAGFHYEWNLSGGGIPLDYDAYVFAATIETDNWKNYTVASGKAKSDVEFSACARASFRFLKSQNVFKDYIKNGEALLWSYDEKDLAKSKRLSVAFVFDPEDQSQYSVVAGSWDESTDPIIYMAFNLCIFLHAKNATRTGTQDIYFKCTKLQLLRGSKLSEWEPSVVDRYSRVPNENINALFT